ncbi:hypothetical protein [Methylocella sp.]|uniref:hypothetical protein n=1 Tax=Methylocella sp. TaxID=1978226 RepID=UPI003782E961
MLVSYRTAGRRRLAAALAFALGTTAAAAQETGAGAQGEAARPAAAAPANKDWPCKQILVEEISLPTVWSGPPIENVEWRKDERTTDLVTLISARRTTLEAAQKAIEEFAAAAGADKNARLTALFAGVFETLNSERGHIIDGLTRFGRKQKALATRIRAENSELQKNPAETPPGVEPADDPATQKLQLDLRIFDEGRKSLSFACEAPTLVEQRLFALARAIQNEME